MEEALSSGGDAPEQNLADEVVAKAEPEPVDTQDSQFAEAFELLGDMRLVGAQHLRERRGLRLRAAARGARFVATPEFCAGLDTRDGKMFPVAFEEAEHPVLPAMQGLGKDLKIWLLIGSVGVKWPDGRIFNRSFLLSPEGEIAARYDKIHLFDIDLGGGRTYQESATIAAGQKGVIAPCAGGMIGNVDLL